MARLNRVKADGEAFYHVVTRIANRAFLIQDAGRKRRLLDTLRRAAEFSGVDVVTYAVMDNHVHLCVRVPDRREVGEAEVLRRVGALYGDRKRDALAQRLSELQAEGAEREREAELGRLRARMGDLSEFMKTFKQRVSQWFNGETGHTGTLWEGRFKSVLVEGGEYLRAVVRYIHGNPVRAGMVRRAEDCEWTALGAAARGDAFAQKGLSIIGMEGLSPAGGGRDRRLSNGVVIGSRGFVERMGEALSARFWPGRRRILAFSHGGTDLFSTHGQRSEPKAS